MTWAAIVLAAAAPPLYEQSVIRVLHDRFAAPALSYLLVEARTERVADARWREPGRPAPLGSLVKPFVALAYGETHGFEYPEFECRGAAGGCWRPRGHGRIGLAQAIAQSCNAYFLALASRLRAEDVAAVARRFGFAPPPEGAGALTLAGHGDEWRIAPADIARAYAGLLTEPGAAAVLRGMALSARSGTAHAAGAGVAKTGTAPCTHQPRAPGDGYAVLADDPGGYVLLVQVHGTTGAQAAVTAARMMRVIKEAR